MLDKRYTLRAILRMLDYPMLLAAAAVYCIGVAVIYSAAGGAAGAGGFFAARQMLWGAVSLVLAAVVLKLDLEFFFRLSYGIYGVCCLMLVLLFVLGSRAKGAQSWINFGLFKVQPAEFAKLGLALVMSHHLCEHPPATLKSFLSALCLGGAASALVLIQPDLGSTLVYGVMIFVSLIAAGTPGKYLLTLAGAGLSFLPAGWLFLKEYQKKRILVFINPELDPLGAGYNVIQSRIAVGAGHFFGTGFMEGTQSKLKFLPEAHTDFIFSVFAEEFGLAGGLILLFLLGVVLWRMIGMALRSREPRVKILTAALASSRWFHSVESIGMSMGLLPVTGLPLPFMSYGGSSLLTSVLSVTVVAKIGACEELDRLEQDVHVEKFPFRMQ